MGAPVRQHQAVLEESNGDVDARGPETLSETVRTFLNFLAEVAVRQALADAEKHAADDSLDAAVGEVRGGPHERRPHR